MQHGPVKLSGLAGRLVGAVGTQPGPQSPHRAATLDARGPLARNGTRRTVGRQRRRVLVASGQASGAAPAKSAPSRHNSSPSMTAFAPRSRQATGSSAAPCQNIGGRRGGGGLLTTPPGLACAPPRRPSRTPEPWCTASACRAASSPRRPSDRPRSRQRRASGAQRCAGGGAGGSRRHRPRWLALGASCAARRRRTPSRGPRATAPRTRRVGARA
jgi:hypothetical protein